MKISRFLSLPVVLAIVLAACSGPGQQTLSTPSVTGDVRTQSSADPGEMLFAAGTSEVDGFALPLSNDSKPVVRLTDVNEPIPVAVGPQDLFVGSFSDGDIFRFKLPLTASSTGERLPVRLAPKQFATAFQTPLSGAASGPSPVIAIGTPSGLAVDQGYLYVAGAAANGRFQVQAFARPVTGGETPAAVIKGYSSIDFLGLAAEGDTLFVASTTQGTIRAFTLPLTSGAVPRYTLHIPPQQNAAIGVATRHHILYVTNYSTGEVLAYTLPHPAKPVRLDLKPANNGSNPAPYAVTASDKYLYVSGNAIYQYRLPVSAGEKPSAIIQNVTFGLAAFPKFAQ
ncbi:MAG TPA: hypothetical protein VGZ02_01245 [Candidatus Baltobacteraceae bacterium]|jgi:hypothetical protein|nr:hypothetical protein [Candidatus Baltobacteraceae bacterium]